MCSLCVIKLKAVHIGVAWIWLARLLTAKCWLDRRFQIPDSAYYHMTSQLRYVDALSLHSLSVGPRCRWFPVSPITQQVTKIIAIQWTSSQEALCVFLYALECAEIWLRTPITAKISWESIPPDPLGPKGCRAFLGRRMFFASAEKFAPLDRKRYVQPWSLLLSHFNDRMVSYQSVYKCWLIIWCENTLNICSYRMDGQH